MSLYYISCIISSPPLLATLPTPPPYLQVLQRSCWCFTRVRHCEAPHVWECGEVVEGAERSRGLKHRHHAGREQVWLKTPPGCTHGRGKGLRREEHLVIHRNICPWFYKRWGSVSQHFDRSVVLTLSPCSVAVSCPLSHDHAKRFGTFAGAPKTVSNGLKPVYWNWWASGKARNPLKQKRTQEWEVGMGTDRAPILGHLFSAVWKWVATIVCLFKGHTNEWHTPI